MFRKDMFSKNHVQHFKDTTQAMLRTGLFSSVVSDFTVQLII